MRTHAQGLLNERPAVAAKAHRLSSQEKAAYYKESAGQCTEIFRLTGVL